MTELVFVVALLCYPIGTGQSCTVYERLSAPVDPHTCETVYVPNWSRRMVGKKWGEMNGKPLVVHNLFCGEIVSFSRMTK